VLAWEQVLKQTEGKPVTNKIISGVVQDTVAAIEAPAALTLRTTEVQAVTEQQYLCGDPLQIVAGLPAGCADLVLISDLRGSTAEKQAAELRDLLDAASGAAKEDHQALVFTTVPDYRPLLAVAEELGYEVGVPFYWLSDSEKSVIDWSARCCGQVVLHLRRGQARLAQAITNVIECDEEAFKSHATQKPLALIYVLIEAATQPGDLVLDLTAGAATSSIAAQQLGRTCIGIESDEEVYAAGLERLNQFRATLQIEAEPCD
jgi:hypothetical protein